MSPPRARRLARFFPWSFAGLLRALGLLVALAATTGCSLPGLDDVDVVYRSRPDAPADLVQRVRLHLRARRFSAEVHEAQGALHVRVPRAEVSALKSTLAHPVKLTFHRRAARCRTGCTEAEIEHLDDRAREAPPGELVLVERLSSGRLRTVHVEALPVATVGEKKLVRGPSGTIELSLSESSTAAKALAEVSDEIVLGDGSRALYIGKVNPRAVRLHYGEGLEAYERARLGRELLGLPELPELRDAEESASPRDLGLAAAAVLLPLGLSLIYIFFVRRFDRAHPEPLSLVLVTFVLGAASTLLAMAAEWGASHLSPWLNPQLLTFGGQPSALPLSVLGFALTVGVPEEGAKLLATLYATKRREFDEPVDGVVYGVVAALGFAAAENVSYFAFGRVAASLVVGRAFTSIPVHMFLSGLWGYSLGQRLVTKRARVPFFFGLSALAHGIFDAFLSTEGGFLPAIGVLLLLAVGFVLVLRSALRHGPVSEATRLAAEHKRERHAVGHPWRFVSLSLLLPLLATVMLGVAGAWEASGHGLRSSYPLVLALLVVAIGATVWGITSTLPLDVVLDSHGLTFAGAVRGYAEIDAVVVHGAYLEIHSPRGDIEIGPAHADQLDTLVRALSVHREAQARLGAG